MEVKDYNQILKEILGVTYDDTKIVNGEEVYMGDAELRHNSRQLENKLDDLCETGVITDLQYKKAYAALTALFGIYKDKLFHRRNNGNVVNGAEVLSYHKYIEALQAKYGYEEMSDYQQNEFDRSVKETYIKMLVDKGFNYESIRNIDGLDNADEILRNLYQKNVDTHGVDYTGGPGRRF